MSQQIQPMPVRRRAPRASNPLLIHKRRPSHRNHCRPLPKPSPPPKQSTFTLPPHWIGPFPFLSLPAELQVHILSYTTLIKSSPARDILPSEPLSSSCRESQLICCGKCEGRVTQTQCGCLRSWKTRDSGCECYGFGHSLLAVSRHVRWMALDMVYRERVFEIGPVDDGHFRDILGIVRAVDEVHLANIKRLDVVLWVHPEMVLGAKTFDPRYSDVPSVALLSWRSLFRTLDQRCRRHDVSIRVTLIGCVLINQHRYDTHLQESQTILSTLGIRAGKVNISIIDHDTWSLARLGTSTVLSSTRTGDDPLYAEAWTKRVPMHSVIPLAAMVSQNRGEDVQIQWLSEQLAATQECRLNFWLGRQPYFGLCGTQARVKCGFEDVRRKAKKQDGAK